MIKINLLAIRKLKKTRRQIESRSQFMLAGVILVFIVFFCSYTLFSINKKIKDFNARKTEVHKQLDQLEEKVKTVENYQENKKNLEEKNKIIAQLMRNQSRPVHVLDAISLSLDPLKLWLTSLTIKGDLITLNGKAVSNSDISKFINRLKRSELFLDVVLIESRQMSEDDIPIYKFHLTSNLAL